MKELIFEKMETVHGGLSCFFAWPYAVVGLAIWNYSISTFVDAAVFYDYCYNN